MSDERADAANLLRAIEFASRKHSTQRRKDEGASPYINHPIAVTHLLADTGGVTDLVTLMAAVLHDTIEDTQTTPEELETQFGRTVRRVVEEMTDDKSLDKAVRKQLQIDHAAHLSARAKAIKLADKIANVQDVTECPPADWDLTRRIGYLDWTAKVVAGCRGTNASLEKLYDQVLEKGRAMFQVQPSGLDEARQRFEEAHIKLPPIPQRFRSDLRTIEDWCFATRDVSAMHMYMFDRYLWEALTGKAPDCLAFSHAGHGINSYALNYHLVDGPLVLMVQAPFGGVYADSDEPLRVEAQFDRCAALIAAVDAAKARGLSDRQGRLVVFESEFRQSLVCGWLDRPLEDDKAAKAWIRAHRVAFDDPDSQHRHTEGELPTNAAREWLEAGSFNERPRYPDRKTRELTDQERHAIRQRLESGETTEDLAEQFDCAQTQVAAIKAWTKR